MIKWAPMIKQYLIPEVWCWQWNWRASCQQPIIPRSERRTVLQYCHYMKTAAHLDITKTLAHVRQKHYSPGLQADTRTYIAGFENCTKIKSPYLRKRSPMKLVKSGITLDRIATDILSELSLTKKDNRYISHFRLFYQMDGKFCHTKHGSWNRC